MIAQQEKFVEHILELVLTDPPSLLPTDRTLLDEDFDKLGAANVTDQAYCIDKMESALKVATHDSERESLHNNQQRSPPVAVYCPKISIPPTATANNAPIIDTEGGIRYWRQRKKLMTGEPSSIETDCTGKLE